MATVAAFGLTARTVASADDKPTISSVVLLDAAADQRIPGRAPLRGEEKVDLAALHTRDLSVQAVTDSKVGSVRFELDGRTTRVENHNPFVLNGDARSGKDYLPWRPAAGRYSLVITPYSKDGAQGKAGAPVRLLLTVTDSGSPATPPPVATQPSTKPGTKPGTTKPATPGTPALPVGRTAGAGIGGPTWSVAELPPTQGGRHRYVHGNGNDKADGLSPATALRTLQRAADLTQPGDTVVIGDGTYSAPGKQFVLGIKRSGTAGKWITYAAAPGARPKIEAAGWQGVAINARYITVAGLTVHGPTDRLTEKQKNAARNGDQRDPMINTNCIAVSEPFGGGESTYPHHVRVHGNTVSGCPLVGISAMHADHVEVSNNLAFGNSNWSPFGGSGISLFQAWNSDGGAGYKMIVRGNVTRDNGSFVKCGCSGFKTITDGGGIIIDSFDNRDAKIRTPYRGRTLVENNITHDNGARGINVFRSDHVDVVNNTVYHNGRQPSIQDNMSVTKAHDVKVVNNILVSPGSGITAASQSSSTGVTFDSNIIVGRTNVTDPHKLTGDPKLAGPDRDDFRLSDGSPAIDSGTRTLAAKTDASMAARTAPVDRGALEHR
ncbi:right-handed parallel beta-helix repeat-containing protein [Actinoplanes sp. NPDC049118]|uniref:right-handed parallel beta-helix repeat-containing protein n=1 Tax=Actinoplanes sp. NPDC049118 TaxID=3155769 RepID=UPI0033C8028F